MLIEISDQTVRELETILAKRNQPVSLSDFVDRAVQRAVFFETVREVKLQNANSEPDEIDRLIGEAVEGVRAEARRAANGAARS